MGRVLYRHGNQTDVGIRWLRMSVATTVGLLAARSLQRRIRRVRLGQGQGIPADTGAATGCQRSVSDGAHAGTTGAHGCAGVTGHTAATHRRHSHRRAHGAHVETAGALRAAARPYSDAHRHPHRHAAHRVDRAIRGRHTAHAGHRGAAHGTRIPVQLLRLKHGHRAHRCRGGLLSRRRCQTAVMKSAVPRLLAVGYSFNRFTGFGRPLESSDNRVSLPSSFLSSKERQVTSHRDSLSRMHRERERNN